MRNVAVFAAIALAGAMTLPPATAYAAHAGAPYKQVNKKTDAGNDTGDAKIDELNAAQLNQNYKGQNSGDASSTPKPK